MLQGWRNINKMNPLVTDLMQARYFPQSDFLNAKMGANPSYVWRSIMEARDLLKRGSRKHIENGSRTKVW